MSHANRRESRGLDRFQVPAASFDVQDFFFLADKVALAHFYGSVAATVEDQGVVSAEQTRSVNAQLQVRFALCRFRRVPKVFHRARVHSTEARPIANRKNVVDLPVMSHDAAE
jgi:hypothetical protein